MTDREPTFLQRVLLRNYRSIAGCDVTLGPLMFLVGHNGSGKSNFLDALRFVADALRTTLDHALRDRGGINEVRRRSSRRPTNFSIRLEFLLEDGARGHYAFTIGSRSRGGYQVQQEECVIRRSVKLSQETSFHVRNGTVQASVSVVPPATADRLYLVNAAGLPAFRPVYDSLSRMGFYNLNPDAIRDLQSPDAGELLTRDGSNLASVLASLEVHHPGAKERIEQYLSKVVPGVVSVESKAIGPRETVEFRQQAEGQAAWRFLAANMSDGTLRALGILVALFQVGREQAPRVPLVGIEEPELALHPAAAGVLLEALREASEASQIIVTSHSPDLLDNKEIASDWLLAVDATDGITTIGPLNDLSRSALRDHLYTAGEMLRLNQLAPDSMALRQKNWNHLPFFEADAVV